MNLEERQLLASLFDRIRSAGGAQRDRDAETFIADAVREQPYAPYLLAQTVIVQEQTMGAAARRIEELEAKVKELEASSNAGSGSFLGGIGKSIFGGGEPQRPAPAPAASPWGRSGVPNIGQPPNPGVQQGPQGGWQQPAPQAGAPWQQAGAPQAAAGGGFLRSAMGTAAGVAGGMMLANSLQGMFGGHHNQQGNSQGMGGFDSAGGRDDSSLFDHKDSSAQPAAFGSTGSSGSIDDGLPSGDYSNASEYEAGGDDYSGGGDVSDA